MRDNCRGVEPAESFDDEWVLAAEPSFSWRSLATLSGPCCYEICRWTVGEVDRGGCEVNIR